MCRFDPLRCDWRMANDRQSDPTEAFQHGEALRRPGIGGQSYPAALLSRRARRGLKAHLRETARGTAFSHFSYHRARNFLKVKLKVLRRSEGVSVSEASSTPQDLSAFARLLGRPDDADEAAIVGEIGRRQMPWPEIARALGLDPDTSPAGCLVEIERVKAEQAAEVERLNAEIDANLERTRAARVKILMLEAIREARDTLHL
ncbi:hypothetical protein MKK63_25140 [Methylobacterium sp. J-088]|uniref:hypothetical protein n=1 Tax=Methylobacterium sp. J-088 TaxID=2836664 RepID=UPI001FBA46BA|nr:hypothetical protein [Methylobacterium sp. J-088]MCJ2065967.1 hypothetical protein [Methylobacterium sp. J-088]